MVTVNLSDMAIALLILEEEQSRNGKKLRELERTIRDAQARMLELSCRQDKIKQVMLNQLSQHVIIKQLPFS